MQARDLSLLMDAIPGAVSGSPELRAVVARFRWTHTAFHPALARRGAPEWNLAQQRLVLSPCYAALAKARPGPSLAPLCKHTPAAAIATWTAAAAMMRHAGLLLALIVPLCLAAKQGEGGTPCFSLHI